MPYEYQEFPKWVYPEGKPPVIVNSADDELAAMADAPPLDDGNDVLTKRRGRPPGSKNKLTDDAE